MVVHNWGSEHALVVASAFAQSGLFVIYSQIIFMRFAAVPTSEDIFHFFLLLISARKCPVSAMAKPITIFVMSC